MLFLSSLDSLLELSLSKLSEVAKSANIWIGGDFNLSDVDWSTNSVPKYATKGTLCQNLLNITAEYSLSQMVTETTHHTDDSDTLIDLFLTNNPSTVNNIIHMPGLGVCKHDTIMVQIDIQPQRTKTPPRKYTHYYVLRIFHVYKCTVNENTNKSAYWYTSQKSSIPDFAKPGIVAEICPSGFVHSSYLPTDWLTLVWTHPLSQIGNTWVLLQHFCPIMKIGWFPSLVMVEFPVLFDSKVLLAQNLHFGWFPSFFMVHSVVWLQRVFHLKSSGWFLFMVPSVAWFKSALCSKSSFWVVPFSCFSFQCCLAPKYFLLKNEHFA